MPKDTKQNPAPSTKTSGVATEAYIYGYQLVLMDLSRQVMTNVPPNGLEMCTAAPLVL